MHSLVVGSVTVGAVVFTVVIGCSGIGHNQKLLDVTLRKTTKHIVRVNESPKYNTENEEFLQCGKIERTRK